MLRDDSILPDDAARRRDEESRRARASEWLKNMKVLAEGGKLPPRPAGSLRPPITTPFTQSQSPLCQSADDAFAAATVRRRRFLPAPLMTMRILSSVGNRRRVARLVLWIRARVASAKRVAPIIGGEIFAAGLFRHVHSSGPDRGPLEWTAGSSTQPSQEWAECG